MDMTFTVNLAWILHPILALLSFSALPSLTFGVMFGFANTNNIKEALTVASKITFSVTGVVMGYAWLHQSLHKGLDKLSKN